MLYPDSLSNIATSEELTIFWMRRDLRLEDNHGLSKALSSGKKVLVLFIFDPNILKRLPTDDARVSFIYDQLVSLNKQLTQWQSSLLICHGEPHKVFAHLADILNIKSVYINKDYERYAINRDGQVHDILASRSIAFFSFKDQVIFEESEVMKANGAPYTVFTPYKNQWLKKLHAYGKVEAFTADLSQLLKVRLTLPELTELGFERSAIVVRNYDLSHLVDYQRLRNFPAMDATSKLSVHLRFGTVSIRGVVQKVRDKFPEFLNELIWREFFMQILFHFPHVVKQNFKPNYNQITWRNNEEEFERWCEGTTGYPLVDAGMRELNATGYMHNRVRMVAASFLCKHLLIEWQWGEAYFASRLLDYELSSNNGNWQWAAGTGCDAAPYFRVFNPTTQQQKFDPNEAYINLWLNDYGTRDYPSPIVSHTKARERAIATYKRGLALASDF